MRPYDPEKHFGELDMSWREVCGTLGLIVIIGAATIAVTIALAITAVILFGPP